MAADSTSAGFLSVAKVRWVLFLQLDYRDAEEKNRRTASALFVHAQPSCRAAPQQVSQVSAAYAFQEVRALYPR